MRNSDIRQEIKDAGLKLWQVAYALNLRDTVFSVKLRLELSDDEKSKIRTVIAQLVRERETV